MATIYERVRERLDMFPQGLGCGICASSCPTESLSMVHKGPDEISPIFPD